MTGCPAAGCIGYELTAPIDLASYGRDYDNGSGWEPVGTGAAPFTAVFDGNDFPIHNLYINRPSETDMGFFGRLGGRALVRSVVLTAIEVTGTFSVGGLAGHVQHGGTILSSAVTGRVVSLSSTPNTGPGGLVGFGERRDYHCFFGGGDGKWRSQCRRFGRAGGECDYHRFLCGGDGERGLISRRFGGGMGKERLSPPLMRRGR